MKKKKRVIIPTVIVCLLVAYILTRDSDFNYAGTIEATRIDISSRVTSVISKFPAKEGQPVSKNAPLVTLACEDIRLAAQSAARDYDRALKLFSAGSLAKEAFDHLTTARDDTALRLSWCSINSPIEGKILDVYHEEGELVNPGTKLLTIADLSEVWAMIYVPQTMLSKLKLNQAIRGYLPEIKKYFDGRIIKINDIAEFTPKNVQTREERTRLVFGIKVTFPNTEQILKPGLSIEVPFVDQ